MSRIEAARKALENFHTTDDSDEHGQATLDAAEELADAVAALLAEIDPPKVWMLTVNSEHTGRTAVSVHPTEADALALLRQEHDPEGEYEDLSDFKLMGIHWELSERAVSA